MRYGVLWIGLLPACGGDQVAPTTAPTPPIVTSQRSKAGNVVYNVSPRELEPLRVQGDKAIAPDDQDKVHLNGAHLVGSFKLCLDETGHYESGTVLKSTGVIGYDARIARAMMAWVYRPFVIDGSAVPVCSAITFIYSQH